MWMGMNGWMNGWAVEVYTYTHARTYIRVIFFVDIRRLRR